MVDMIPMTLAQIAAVTGGIVDADDPQARVTGPAYLDSREPVERGLFVAIKGSRVDGHDHVGGAHAVLGSRRTDRPTVLVDDPVVALGRLARHVVRAVGPRVHALTGSHGKTTTKDLLADLIPSAVATAGNLNNELGVPLTCLRLQPGDSDLVLEMGARGVGHLAWLVDIARPDIAAVLAVGTAHIGEFGSGELLCAAKSELVQALAPGGTAVLNADDPAVAAMARLTPARTLTFGRSGDVSVSQTRLDAMGRPHFRLGHEGRSVPVQLSLIGEHQVMNAAAAAAIALAAGLDLDTVAERLSTVHEVSPHRLVPITTASGVLVIDDSYNANPASTAASLKVLAEAGAHRSGRTIAVLGGMRELGALTTRAHRDIGALARHLGIDRLLAIGDAAPAAEVFGRDATVVADSAGAIGALGTLSDGDSVLVKGSRACALEVVVAHLIEAHGGALAGSPA